MLMKERNGAVDQKKGHHGIDRFGVPGKEFAERGAKHCPYKTTGGSDQREYDGEPGQGQRCLVYGKYVQGHRRDRIDIDFRIRELETIPERKPVSFPPPVSRSAELFQTFRARYSM